MLDRIKNLRAGTLGLAAAVSSLALLMILVGGQVAGADDGPRRGGLEPDRAAAGLRGPATPQGIPLRQPSSPTAGGDWDGHRVSWPMVISDTDRYRMWYMGYNPANPGWGWMLGMAESFDGTTWAKSPSNPVLGPGDPGAWDEMYRGLVAVLKDGGEYKLWYTGSDDSENGVWETGYATSTNGVDWNVYAGNPVLTKGPGGSWEEGEADGASVIKDGGLYKMWYHGCNDGWTICSIGYTTSTNGIDWIKYAGNPVLTATGGAWDDGLILYPRVVENGGAYEMWYLSQGHIGRATSPDGVNWTKYASNPVISESWDGGSAYGQTVLLEGSTYRMWLTGGSGVSRGIGYAESTEGITWTMSLSNPVLAAGEPGVTIDVNYGHDWVAGRTGPGVTTTITVTGGGGIKATATGQADEWGDFRSWEMTWDPERPNIEPGDVVTASVGAVSTAVNPVGTIDGDLDLEANTVSGTLHADSFAPLTLTVRCEIWEDNGPTIVITDVAAAGGQFLCDFDDEGWDVQAGEEVMVRYEEPDGDTVIDSAEWPWMRVRYADYDQVEGNYEAGHTFWITVTDSVGTVRATAEIETNTEDGWGGDGFYTQDEHWSPDRPDIQVDDRVQFASDDGYSNTVRVGDIQGTLNAEDDIISGTVLADWFSGMLDVECHAWGAPDGTPSKDSTAAADGSSYYSCQWDPDTEWDIEPGQEVAVMYIEPDDGDRVIHTFEEPAPDARVDKWVEGNEVAPGGPVVFTLRYRNEGDATAETILLTDTLPADTSYVDDTSGVAATVDGNQVSWTLGPLEPDYEEAFQLLLTNTALAGDTLTNTADIYTQYDNRDWNDHDEAEVDVASGDLDLYVNQNPDPRDPAPGQTFLYKINYGNDGPVASGAVVLTDTLPENTSLVSWESEHGYELWTQQSSDPLVLTAPTVPGHWGDRLLVRLELDSGVSEGARLTNTVEITTAGDIDPGNNWELRDDVWAGNPSWGGRVEKNFGWGELVPDGYIVYNIRARNDGNMATQMVLTDSLPADVSFSTSWLNKDPLHVPFPPDYQDDEILVWELGLVEPGEEYDLSLELEIEAPAWTELGNCTTLAISDVDEWPQDNEDCVTETVYPPGPNLRVRKWHDWDGDDRLDWRIQVENVGNATASSVVVTDTYPAGTTFNDWYRDVWWGTSQFNHDPGQRLLTWAFDEVEPSWGGQLGFNVDLDSPGPVQWYTNVVTITLLAGDPNHGDNSSTDVAFTGGEVERVEIDVGGRDIWGDAPQGPITITTPYTWTVLPWDGYFDWNAPDPIQPGDVITVEAGAGLYPVVIEVPTPFVASASSISDTVWGVIDHLDQEWIEVNLYDGPSMEVQTNIDGEFSATFDDIPRRGDGEVRYTTEIAYAEVTFHRYFRTLDPVVRADVEEGAFAWGEYEEGHAVSLTVLGSDGSTIRGTADMVTEPVPDWGDFVGWATDHTGPWVLHPSEIRPLDHVHVELDNGYTNTLQIGTITGHVDVDNDRITGTVDAPWLLPETVRIQCETWGAPESAPNPEGKEDNVLPNGTDVYECSWDGVTEWDVEPGQDIAVSYYEPDDDQVRKTLWAPAPDVRVEKWTEGHEVPPNGPVVFTIRYQNEGDAASGTILLTDTLPANTTYVDDTSGAAASGGGQVSWTLGPLEPGYEEVFQLLLANTATAGERLTNTVDIYTQYDRGDWNNHDETEVDVASGDPNLYVNKDPDPGDPAPGQTFLYRIHYGNDAPVASGAVVLTDTIPEDTTVVSWESENGYELWTEQSSDPLVLTAPTVPGWWGDTLLLRLALDGGVSPGTRLTNTVEITTAGDTDPGDNWQQTDDAWASDPRWSGWIHKRFDAGELVPGGHVEYRISARNAGNMAAQTDLVDNLPAGLSFDRAWREMGHVRVPFPPDYQDASVLIWDLGVLEPGEQVELRVELDIGDDVAPGTILENCAHLDLEGDEACPHSCVQDRVNGAGANLRVSKEYDWWGEDRLHYEIRFDNVGNQDLDGVLITDTYPISTTVADWGVGYWRWITDTHHPAQRQMVFWVEQIERGSSGSIWMDMDLDPGIVGQPGIAFTNTVEAPIAGDVDPTDNQDQVTAYSNVGSEVTLGTGWNLVAPDIETHPPTSASTALQEIWEHGGDAPEIYRWLSEADAWEGHGRCLPFNNYDLALGQGYFLRAERDSTWWRQGVPPESPVPVTLNPIWTLAGLPHLPCPLTARDLLGDIAGQGGTCSEVYRWDQGLGDWEGFDPGMGGDGFDLAENEGYFVNCASATSYEPGASGICGALAASGPAEPAILSPEPDMEPVANPAISDIQVTNHRDVALSITWRTDGASTGWIEYGQTAALGQTAHDDLGAGTLSQVHQVTLTGLTPETTYSFRVHSGNTVDDNGGALYQVTTKATGMPPIPYLAYGQVETTDGQPATGALVRVWLVDKDNKSSDPLSTLVDGYGYWSMSLPVDRCKDLDVRLQAIGRQGSEASLTQPACEVKPAPVVRLSEEGPEKIYLPVVVRQRGR